MWHVSEPFILQSLEKIMDRILTFESNAGGAAESWAYERRGSRHRLAEDTELGHTKTLAGIEGGGQRAVTVYTVAR